MTIRFLARLALLFFLTSIPINSTAKEWRGITPLHSTCEDVKRVLSVDTCTYPMATYELMDFRVTVFFSEGNCGSEKDWRVPAGTVTGVWVSPQRRMLPSELGIDMSKYKKVGDTDVVGVVSYTNLEEGSHVDLTGNFVQWASFFAQKSDDNLSCKSKVSQK